MERTSKDSRPVDIRNIQAKGEFLSSRGQGNGNSVGGGGVEIDPTRLSIACRESSRHCVEEHLANDALGHSRAKGQLQGQYQ